MSGTVLKKPPKKKLNKKVQNVEQFSLFFQNALEHRSQQARIAKLLCSEKNVFIAPFKLYQYSKYDSLYNSWEFLIALQVVEKKIVKWQEYAGGNNTVGFAF